MILAQVRDELNQVNRLLDKYDAIRETRSNSETRQQLLRRAASASTRGVEAVIEDQLTRLPPGVGLSEADAYRLLEEMRQDEALLRLFIRTEMRLLEDLGVAPEAIGKIEESLRDVLPGVGDPTVPPTELSEDRLLDLVAHFEESLIHLESDGRHREIRARLAGVVQTLGGALLIGVNGVAGLGFAAVTVAVSAAGAAVSIAAGAEVINRGAVKALGE